MLLACGVQRPPPTITPCSRFVDRAEVTCKKKKEGCAVLLSDQWCKVISAQAMQVTSERAPMLAYV